MGPPLLDAEIDVVSESPGIHSANPPGVVSTLSTLRGRCPKREREREREPVAQRQEMVIGTLALLWYFMMVAVV